LQVFQKYGNEVINRILEGKIKDNRKPNPNSEGKEKEAWIREKYLELRYMDTSLVPSYPELKYLIS